MTCKMLFFDYRESEKQFFENHKCDYFDLKFFNHPLNEETVETLSEEDLAQTMIVSVLQHLILQKKFWINLKICELFQLVLLELIILMQNLVLTKI